MKDLRREVGVIGPGYGAEIRADAELAEELEILQRLEDRSPQLRFEIDLAGRAVAERSHNT